MFYKALVLFVAVLVAAAEVQSVQSTCPVQEPDQKVKLCDLCGVTAHVIYQYGYPEDTSCVIAQFVCNQNKSITLLSHFFVEGYLSRTLVSLITEISQGVIKREYLGPGTITTGYIVSYKGTRGGDMKMTSMECAEGATEPARITMVSNYEADFSSEFTLLQTVAPNQVMSKLPNQCAPTTCNW